MTTDLSVRGYLKESYGYDVEYASEIFHLTLNPRGRVRSTEDRSFHGCDLVAEVKLQVLVDEGNPVAIDMLAESARRAKCRITK
jgi:hypothetical protein